MLKAMIPELKVADRRLGRIIEHDPRSLRYTLPRTVTRKTVRWGRVLPILDQGDLGSCTGNAAVGCLGTEPYHATLPPGTVLGEPMAVKVYSLATHLDEFSGTYTPDDTGSSGLGAAKALKQLGLISGYLHATSIDGCHTAIQRGPFMVGSHWYEGMDTPDRNTGLVSDAGQVRGGHEYECVGYDLNTDRWTFANSWGLSYGIAGYFSMTSAMFGRLLANYGDATSLVPNTLPAPVPAPDLTRITRSFARSDYDLLTTWAAARHYTTNKAAADAWKRGTL